MRRVAPWALVIAVLFVAFVGALLASEFGGPALPVVPVIPRR